MANWVNLVASIVTVANFVLWAIGLLPDVEPFADIRVSPAAAFILFFLLETLCSLFICYAIVKVYKAAAPFFLVSCIFFGLINVATSLFNFKVLFGIQHIESDATLFTLAAFLFGAFIVDVVVMRAVSLNHNSKFVVARSMLPITGAERRFFMLIQGTEYFLAARYIGAISRAI